MLVAVYNADTLNGIQAEFGSTALNFSLITELQWVANPSDSKRGCTTSMTTIERSYIICMLDVNNYSASVVESLVSAHVYVACLSNLEPRKTNPSNAREVSFDSVEKPRD
jgi:hypothetical protein